MYFMSRQRFNRIYDVDSPEQLERFKNALKEVDFNRLMNVQQTSIGRYVVGVLSNKNKQIASSSMTEAWASKALETIREYMK